ncbi:uncharacterized protein LOC130928092 isoform X2 [Corythoichthys intestinalis]|uniref:uncharacterized protein LOC130928092 isoform X2 n=1 Tax=Corythoichthys intestinalis TaxID=161448 RepID=UPI0025A53582|nr:uncharacterized protein LOC130928092 isoform X2 [Corythoichthys intestinalis]
MVRYFIVKDKSPPPLKYMCLVIKSKEKQTILMECHNNSGTGNSSSVEGTSNRAIPSFYWPTMIQDINEWLPEVLTANIHEEVVLREESETFVLQTPSEDGHILNGLTVSGHGAGSLQNSGESITTCTQLRSSIGMGSSSNNPHEDLLEEGKRGKVTAFYCDEETPTGYCICSCCPMQ